MQFNPRAILFWAVCAGIGYLIGGVVGAIAGFVIGGCASMLADMLL